MNNEKQNISDVLNPSELQPEGRSTNESGRDIGVVLGEVLAHEPPKEVEDASPEMSVEALGYYRSYMAQGGLSREVAVSRALESEYNARIARARIDALNAGTPVQIAESPMNDDERRSFRNTLNGTE